MSRNRSPQSEVTSAPPARRAPKRRRPTRRGRHRTGLLRPPALPPLSRPLHPPAGGFGFVALFPFFVEVAGFPATPSGRKRPGRSRLAVGLPFFDGKDPDRASPMGGRSEVCPFQGGRSVVPAPSDPATRGRLHMAASASREVSATWILDGDVGPTTRSPPGSAAPIPSCATSRGVDALEGSR